MNDEAGVASSPLVRPHLLFAPPRTKKSVAPYLSSVVKVFVVRSKVSYVLPWQKRAPKNATGSGFCISDQRILTNAHVVEGHTAVLVRRHGNPKRYEAQVVCIGYQCDIALLKVDDVSFWHGYTPLKFGKVPALQDSVTCVGYPTGGDNISVTCGVVSRVDVRTFVGRYCALLAVQIDAAINSGNSGGPVFKGDKVVGIAFSSHTRAQNIGHIIPVPIIKRFLTEYDTNGSCTICESAIKTIHVENGAIRSFYGMKEGMSGILVVQVHPLSPLAKNRATGAEILKAEDIILSVDNVRIADDGTIIYRGDERVNNEYLFGIKYTGEILKLKVLRDKQELELQTIMHWTPPLVPRIHGFDCFGSYYVVGGLVFVPLTIPFLKATYGDEWQKKAPISLLMWVFSSCGWNVTESDGQTKQVVVLSQLLASKVTVGYTAGSRCVQVNSFQGIEIVHLRQLVELVEAALGRTTTTSSTATTNDTPPTLASTPPAHSDTSNSSISGSGYLNFDVGDSKSKIILSIDLVRSEDANILATHAIASNKSQDLLIPATTTNTNTNTKTLQQHDPAGLLYPPSARNLFLPAEPVPAPAGLVDIESLLLATQTTTDDAEAEQHEAEPETVTVLVSVHKNDFL
eukprot:TRINITY_DN2738_c0_g1_i1.p1 TRINITY_DN2738_c0_g1~~TRINITY_DN2738_c0_g1_i1.p1  ORF type:complete len:629 (-),score=95.96 TRINITY_DN2738_c0_g1_i1:30-1916(-)